MTRPRSRTSYLVRQVAKAPNGKRWQVERPPLTHGGVHSLIPYGPFVARFGTLQEAHTFASDAAHLGEDQAWVKLYKTEIANHRRST